MAETENPGPVREAEFLKNVKKSCSERILPRSARDETGPLAAISRQPRKAQFRPQAAALKRRRVDRETNRAPGPAVFSLYLTAQPDRQRVDRREPLRWFDTGWFDLGRGRF